MSDPRTKFSAPGKDESPQAFPGLESHMRTKPEYGRESYHGSGKLAGKTALITGADSGIGRAVAVAFAREGAHIAFTHLPEEEADAAETRAAITEAGREVMAIPGYLQENHFCHDAVSQTLARFGSIDILVNNAAVQKYFSSVADMTLEDFERIFQVNVFAPFLLTQAALPGMAPGSCIINTVSIQAYEPSSMLLPYAASKGALIALTKGLAKELISQGIRVNGVAPGPIWSPLNTHGSPPEKLRQFGGNTPIGRPGQPVELAPVYVLLASDEANYIRPLA